MRINCFKPAPNAGVVPDRPDAPRLATRVSTVDGRSKRSKTFPLKRNGGSQSSRASSNSSISSLPPCPGLADPRVAAMMMPEPTDPVPSKCLRLSHPRTYGNIVADMKACKGCRDWRNFDVFYADDVDMKKSAIDVARKRALDYERKMRQLDSFDSDASIELDTIG